MNSKWFSIATMAAAGLRRPWPAYAFNNDGAAVPGSPHGEPVFANRPRIFEVITIP